MPDDGTVPQNDSEDRPEPYVVSDVWMGGGLEITYPRTVPQDYPPRPSLEELLAGTEFEHWLTPPEPGIEPQVNSLDRCHAGEDGDCSWDHCPQRVEYRSPCPLPWWGNDDEY